MADIAVTIKLEILDIRHFSARQLRPLLEVEAALWQRRLRWDYKEATNLLLRYLDSRMLPGFVALDQGKVCGFTFCVFEGYKAVIGDVFAVDNRMMQALPTAHELLHQLIQLVLHTPETMRVESQLLLYGSGDLGPPFSDGGFQTYRRLFMQLDLQGLRSPKSSWNLTLPYWLMLSQWTAGDYHSAAEFIRTCYVGHIDSKINDQYCSMEGSLRFLHNVVYFPGCGTFDAKSSWVLRERVSGKMIGILLCSQVQYNTAHITQLCVSPSYRGQKLGRLLLAHAVKKLMQSGFETITLTVTEKNRNAVDLYLSMDFSSVHQFDAHVYNKR